MNDRLRRSLWFIGMSAAVPLVVALTMLDAEVLTNPKAWAIGVGIQVVRAGAKAALELLTTPTPPHG